MTASWPKTLVHQVWWRVAISPVFDCLCDGFFPEPCLKAVWVILHFITSFHTFVIPFPLPLETRNCSYPDPGEDKKARRQCPLSWHKLCLSNIRYQDHDFWIVCIHQLRVGVCVSTKSLWSSLYTWGSCDQTVNPYGNSSWWLLLVIQVVTFKWPWIGSCDKDNWMLNGELT